MPNYKDKTKDELINELKRLQLEYDSLKTSFEKYIAEFRLKETAMKESEELFHLLFVNSGEAILLTNPDGSIYSANPEACRISGRSEDEICRLGRNSVCDLNDPRLELALNERKKTGKFKGELNLLRQDGTVFPAEITSNIFTDASGNERTSMIVRDISERKEAEKKLRLQSEIMKNISEGINLIRVKDEVIVFTNPRFDKIFGYYSGELIGKHVSILNAPSGKSPEEIKQDIVGAVNLTGEWHGEILNIKKNGDFFWCYVNVSTFDHPDFGKVYFSVHTNINKRKKAEEALQLEKENFRHSLEESPLGVRIATIEGNTIYANKTLLDLYGYDTLDELQQTPLKNQYTTESYSQAQERKRQRERGDSSSTDYEISIIRKNGEIRHLQVFRKEVIWDGLRQFQIIYEDITRRKLAEAALIESEAKFRSIFENSFVGISISRPGSGLLHVNHAYARMYGYENPELLLSEVDDTTVLFANPEERKKVIRELHRDGFMEPREFELIRRDGSRFFALVSAREIKDTEGKLLYNQATHIDLTERRIMEEELRGSKELLEKLNQRLNEIRENERAVISREIHDQLGQSMTALKLDLNRLQRYLSANPEAMAKLESMVELVSDTIKDVQRISSDLRPGILDELGLVSAVEWYCDEFEKRTGIKCTLELENSDIDDSQVSLTFFRVLQETLTNVIRHAKASVVKITLRQTIKGTTLVIKDNGIGIPGDKIDSNKSLGLISMRERVRQFNGTIDISSKNGKGTKLTFFIPL